METKTNKNVAVIGLGNMGVMLAKLLLQQGYPVTVWNRTPAKGREVVDLGATPAATVTEAFGAADLIILCVFDYAASTELINQLESPQNLAGKTVVQLTTGSPTEAVDFKNTLGQWHVSYLDGAILAAPEQMGLPDTTILLAGDEAAYRKHLPLLQTLGGNLKYLGQNIRSASAMDYAAQLYMYGSLIGFFQGALIAEAEGFSVELLGDAIQEMAPGFSKFIRYQAGVIQSGNFEATQSVLSINTSATAQILTISRAYGINTAVPALIAQLFSKAQSAGYENEELGALIKVFRNPD